MSSRTRGPQYWNTIVERTINERRKVGKAHLYIGDHYEHDFPLLAPRSMLERHGVIFGPPGSGKSVLATQLAIQFLEYEYNLLYVELKGSYGVLNDLLHCITANRNPSHEIRVFNPFHGFPSHIYNPMQQRVWRDAPAHVRAEMWNDASGIRGVEGTDSAFFAALSFLCSTEMISYFPDIASVDEFFDSLNDRHLFIAKGGTLKDWYHLRHLAATMRQLAECGPVRAIAANSLEEIELSNLFTAEMPQFYYFFLSAVEEQRTSETIGKLLLQQLKRAVFRLRTSRRRTIIIFDEAQNIFGPTFLEVLELLREFGVSVLLVHQSRAQLVTPVADFRDRLDNAVGFQICLGARTPEDLAYLRDTSGETIGYSLSWTQPIQAIGDQIMVHPQLAYQRNPWSEPQLLSVGESKRPRLDLNSILQISSDPQAGFIRGFLNERLWPYSGTWVPFRWHHHITPEQYGRFTAAYPGPLPGQKVHDVPTDNSAESPNPYSSITAPADPAAVIAAITQIATDFRNKRRDRKPTETSDGSSQTNS